MLNLALHDPPFYLLNHLLLQPLFGREAFMFLLLGACKEQILLIIWKSFFFFLLFSVCLLRLLSLGWLPWITMNVLGYLGASVVIRPNSSFAFM